MKTRALGIGWLACTVGCQLVYPDEVSTACEAPGAFCDDFERATPLPAAGSRWAAVVCDANASATGGGGLRVRYPAHTGDGLIQHRCYLETLPTRVDRRITLDTDVTMRAGGPSPGIIANVGISGAGEAGLRDLQFQVVVDGDGRLNLVIVHFYPDRAPAPRFVATSVGITDGPWLVPGTRCHVHVELDPLIPTFGATATCDGASANVRLLGNTPARGMIGAATLQLGFDEIYDAAYPEWTLEYDNLALRVE